jgi:signal transduction histidine kinase/ActR/RegA family two-component response regulator
VSIANSEISKYEIVTDIPIPKHVLYSWQSTINIMGESLDTQAGLIMRVHPRHIEVLVATDYRENVYSPGELASLNTGLYCEKVMTSRTELQVPDARVDPTWDHNPDIELGMVAYLGKPILWPDGRVFGTICVLDNKEHHFESKARHLFSQFHSVVQNALAVVYENHLLLLEKENAARERSIAEARYAHAHKLEAIGILAGGIAHDFNNILSAIIGFTEVASISAEDPKAVRRHLSEVLQAGKRAQALVNQILTFARPTSNTKKPVQLSSIVVETVKLLRASLPATIEIEHEIESTASIMGDSSQIHQIVMNLCTNAKYAMPDGGILTVRVVEVMLDEDFARCHQGVKPGRHLQLIVCDTGVGMSQKVQQHIFDPFFSGRETGGGSGMGLSVVHGIIKDLHGAITVYSELGKKTIFNVFLPIIDVSEQLPQGDEEPDPTGNERILFVDDEGVLRRLAKESLGRLGYHVTTSEDGLEALELVKSNPDAFDLVITDMTMPNLPGDRLATQLLDIRGDLPIIVCTGFSERIDASNARSLGIAGFITKPLTMKKLASVIRDILDQKS